MSFRCQGCGELQPVYSCPVRVVLETRPGKNFGREIVREANYCEPCFAATRVPPVVPRFTLNIAAAREG